MKSTLAFLSMLLTISAALACDCNSVKGISQEIGLRDFILEGKVLRVDSIMVVDSVELQLQQNNPGLIREAGLTHFPVAKYEVELIKIHKGKIAADTIIFYSPIRSAYCGMELQLNERYIIYGNKNPDVGTDRPGIFPTGNNIVWSHHCTRTRLANEQELRILRLKL